MMVRCVLIDAFDYARRNPREAPPVVEAILRLEDDAGGFGGLDRRRPGIHFTASMLVLDSSLRLAPVIEHAEYGDMLVPGGHVEAGESTIEGALCEVR